ncbi:fibronectin type III domain-containing protein [Microbacterium sp. AZCO]|uniref:fibronectin type III domain-containing protein n=1 Tax=Microbacterium sp. AZCO TaxID=3142976 RepID=UPI0031F40747
MRTDRTPTLHRRPARRIGVAVGVALTLALGAGIMPAPAFAAQQASVSTGARPATDAPPIPFVPTPTITGYPGVGYTLTVVPGPWPEKTRISYVWLADGKPLVRVPSTTLTLEPAQIGKRISVTVIGVKSGYAVTTRTSLPTAPVVGPNTTPSAPIITSTVTDRDTRSITVTWKPGPPGTSPITGWIVARSGAGTGPDGPLQRELPADARSIVFDSLIPDLLYKISVTAVSAAGPGPAAQTSAIVPPRPMQPGAATIVGSPTPFSTLRVDVGAWVPADADFRYEWWRNNRRIFAWSENYWQVAPSDLGATFFVVVRAEKRPLWASGYAQTDAVVIVSGPPGD